MEGLLKLQNNMSTIVLRVITGYYCVSDNLREMKYYWSHDKSVLQSNKTVKEKATAPPSTMLKKLSTSCCLICFIRSFEWLED